MLAAAVYLLFSQVFLVTQAPGNGMFPSIRGGDLLIGFRLQREYVKNDVVVYELGGEVHVGRVLGRAGDVVTIDEDGTVLLNGTQQNGDILYPTYPGDGVTYPCTVPEGCVFVLGDYRTEAEDSRKFGCIPLENVQAKVITNIRRRAL